MKKIIALALSLIMVLSLSVSAFAAEVEAANGTDKSDVTATYHEGSVAADTYSVVIAWANFAFTYSAGQKTWDPDNHTLTDGANGQWSTAGVITVTNHSNVKITASAAYAPEANYDGEVTFACGAAINLDPPAVDSAYNSALSGTITVTPDGPLDSEWEDNAKIGTVTVTITKYVAA